MFLNFELIETSDAGYLSGNSGVLLKIDSLGNKQWMKKFIYGNFAKTFLSMAKVNSGYITTGSSQLLKLDNNYSISWIDSLTGINGIGVSSILYTIRETPDKGFIIGGELDYHNPYPEDYFFILIKTDSLGTVQWSKSYLTPEGDLFGFLALAPDGGYVLTGTSQISASSNTKIMVLKTDSAGNSQWAKRFYPPNLNAAPLSYHITPTSDSCYVLAVSRYPHESLFKIDSAGNQVWAKYYEADLNGAFRWVEETKDKGFIAVGDMEGLDSGWVGRTCLMIKTDIAGNVEWARELGGYGDVWGICVKQTEDGGYAVAVRKPDSNGDDAIGIIKADSLGHTNGCMEGIPIVTVTNLNDTMINVPVIDSVMNVTAVSITLTHPLIGSEITYCAPVGIQEISNENRGIIFYPNPSNGYFSIVSSFHLIENIRISDLSGRIIFSKEKILNNSYECKLNVPDGIYIAEVFVNGNTYRSKIVITH